MALLFAWPVAAAAPAGNDTCLMCHADKDAKNDKGKPIAVDPERFKASVHGEMQIACTSCHTDASASKLPHAEKLKPVDCAGCHEKAVGEYRSHGSRQGEGRRQEPRRLVHRLPRHARHPALEGRRVAHQSPQSRSHLLEVPRQRRLCREGPTARRQRGQEVSTTASTASCWPARRRRTRLGAGVHRLPRHARHSRQGRPGEPRQPRPRARNLRQLPRRDPRQVHRRPARQAAPAGHDRSPRLQRLPHARTRSSGTTCPSSSSTPSRNAATATRITSTSYRDTFHGKVTNLGYTQVATCAACHGAHEMLPASNPASKVSARQSAQDLPGLPPGRQRQFRRLGPTRQQAQPRAQSALLLRCAFHGSAAGGRVRILQLHTAFWFYRSLRVRLARGKAHGKAHGNHGDDKGEH